MSNTKPKKTWSKPEIYILDSPQGGGPNNRMNERTGVITRSTPKPGGLGAYVFRKNQAGTLTGSSASIAFS